MSEATHPAPLAAAWWLAQVLRPWANQMAARFNAPVYLVGSALTEEHPRDVDVRIVLPDEAFLQRYGCSWEHVRLIGPSGTQHEAYPDVCRYWRDVAKLGAWASKHHSRGLNFDLQVEGSSWAEQFAGLPRIRLDDVQLDD